MGLILHLGFSSRERKKYAAFLLIKHKYKVAKTAKVLFLFLFVRKYTFSTPDKKKNP